MESNAKCSCSGKHKIIMVIVAVVLLAAAFYAGAKYEKNKLSNAGLLKGSSSAPKQSTPKAPKTGTTPQNATAGTKTPTANMAPQTGANDSGAANANNLQ
jgi:hypothetical protein